MGSAADAVREGIGDAVSQRERADLQRVVGEIAVLAPIDVLATFGEVDAHDERAARRVGGRATERGDFRTGPGDEPDTDADASFQGGAPRGAVSPSQSVIDEFLAHDGSTTVGRPRSRVET